MNSTGLLNERLEEVYRELDDRLLRAVNGSVPELIKTELRQVLEDLGLAIIPNKGGISSENVVTLNNIIYSYLSSQQGSSPEIDGYQILHHLQAEGWIILPPQ